MSRRRRRSEIARQRRFVRRLVRLKSFQDRRLAESVNVLGAVEIAGAVSDNFGSVWLGATDEFSRGEILSDGRGAGSLQQVTDDELGET